MTTRPYRSAARDAGQRDTRRRILDAARAAFMDGPYESATLAGIAAAAGVSHQTVLNHFASKEGLFLAVGAEVGDEIMDRRSSARAGDPRSCVDRLVEDYEVIGDANVRVEALEDRFPEVAQLMTEARANHRAWLAAQFAPWLDIPAPARRRRLALLEVATNVHTWKHLRRHRGLGRRTTGALMLQMVEAALGPAPAERHEETP
jgi:AcrR family transcriptional regulator